MFELTAPFEPAGDQPQAIWWDEVPSKLGVASRQTCSDPNNELNLVRLS